MPLAQAAHHGMKKDIVDVTVENGPFTPLVTALQAAELAGTLKGKGPFTAVASTDEAFSKLPEGTTEMLLLPENNQKLVSTLTYHVVPGKVMAADVMKINTAKTLQGQSVKVTTMDGKVMINDANVVKADVETSNGVIHVMIASLCPNKL